jgi:hypothetical protein
MAIPSSIVLNGTMLGDPRLGTGIQSTFSKQNGGVRALQPMAKSPGFSGGMRRQCAAGAPVVRR